MLLFDGWIVNHAQKPSKLPYFRLFRPDTQILSGFSALYWPSTAFYWPSTTKYQPVPPHTDPVPSWVNHYRLILIQNHQVPTSRAPYWPSTIMYQPVSPSSDPVPPSTDRYRLLLTQYHHISTSTAPYWHSTTKYQSIPTYNDPVPSYINQYRLLLTQYHQVPTSTTSYWPSTTKYQPLPLSTDPVPSYINQCPPMLLLLEDYRLLHSLPWVLSHLDPLHIGSSFWLIIITVCPANDSNFQLGLRSFKFKGLLDLQRIPEFHICRITYIHSIKFQIKAPLMLGVDLTSITKESSAYRFEEGRD